MFKASSLLLLTLLLNIQLCSSAPIPAKVVQSSAVAEEPGPEELPPVTELHSHSIEDKESPQENLIPVAAGKAAPFPQKPPAKEDIPVIVKEPESVSIGDQVSVDDDEAVSKDSATQEPLPAAPQESSEQETVSAEAAVAEASPSETTEEIATAVAVESESSEQRVENPASEAPIPVIPLEASESEATEENAAAEAAPEEPLLIVPDDNTVVEEEPLHLTPEEEISVVLVPAEHKAEEAAQVKPAAGETAPQRSVPEDPAVIVPVEPAEQESPQEKQEETVPIILSEAKDKEAQENHANEEEEAAPVILKENVESDQATNEEPLPSTSEKEESVNLFPIELEGQAEPAAEETVPEKSVPGEPAVIVPVDPVEQESPQEEQKETVPIILSGTKGEEAPEEDAKEEEEVVPVVLEENTEMDPATPEELLPSTLEEEESVNLFPLEHEGQVEPAAEETMPERSVPGEPAVIVPLEPAEQEPTQEKQGETVPIILSDTKGEEAPEEDAKEEEEVVPVVLEENTEMDLATNEEPLPSTLKEEESVNLFPIELEGQVEPVAGDKASEGSVPEEPAVIVPVEPVEQEPAQEEQEETVPIISSETKEVETPEEHAKVEEAVPSVVIEENTEVDPPTNKELLSSTLEEEESVNIIPKELESEGEPAAKEKALLESAPEDPVVTVTLDPTKKEPELEEQVGEESIPIVSPEQPDEEAPEAHTEAEAAGVPDPIVEEENADKEPEPLPSIPEEKESVVLVHAELDTEDKGKEEAGAEETAPEKPAVIILVEPTSEEPDPEDPILIIPLEDLEKNNTEEEVVQSDPLLKEAALDEDTTSQENDTGDSEAEILVTSVSETPSENETIEISLDQGEEVPVAATKVPVATPEPVTALTPTVTDAQEETVQAPVEGGNGTSIKIHSKDIKSAVKLIEEEPEVLLNRGAFLGAAFFTLVLFITIGVVWTTISKKLR